MKTRTSAATLALGLLLPALASTNAFATKPVPSRKQAVQASMVDTTADPGPITGAAEDSDEVGYQLDAGMGADAAMDPRTRTITIDGREYEATPIEMDPGTPVDVAPDKIDAGGFNGEPSKTGAKNAAEVNGKVAGKSPPRR